MRRGIGIAGIQRQIKVKEHYREAGTQLMASQVEQMKQQMETFKSHLETFALRHQKEIKKDPQFRRHFQQMCASIGVDPLASNKGFWAEMLGVGDFYYELGVQIIEICLETKPANGGLLELSKLLSILQQKRDSRRHQVSISEDDVVRAIKGLKPLGSGFEIIKYGDKTMVRSVPRELSTDHLKVLKLAEINTDSGIAATNGGFVDVDSLIANFGWSRDASQAVLDHMLADGLCWLDCQAESGLPLYWISSFTNLSGDGST